MGVSSFFKNLFGKANIDVDSLANQAETMATEAIAKAKEASAPLVEKVMEYVPVAKETIENTIEIVKEKASEYAVKAEELAKSTSETVKEKITELTSDSEPATTATETVKKIEEDAD